MKILFLSRWFPYPMNNGSKLRIYNLLRGLSKHHEVTLLCFADQPDVTIDIPEIRSVCSDVYTVLWKEFNPHSLRARLGFLSLKPRSIIDTFSPEMSNQITGLLNKQRYNLVIASELPMAAYYPYFKNLPALFEDIELGLSDDGSLRKTGGMKQFRNAITWLKLRSYLSRLFKSFKAVTVVSEQERKLMSQYFPGAENVAVIPNCINLTDYKNIHVESRAKQLIFTGSFRYHTNYEAMLWFAGEVFPHVLEQVPDAELIITGDHANLPLPSDKNVTLAGYVDDIKGLIASSSVSIAPLWSGGGTRLKILEAMAIGIPVVATSKGAEGLDVCSGEHLFIADDPIEFSNYVIRLLRDETLHRDVAQKAYRLVQEKYDWGVKIDDFVKLVVSVVVNQS